MKKLTFAVLVIVLTMTFCFAVSIDFIDLSDSHWAYSTIIKMAEEGLIKGYEDGTFKPEKEVTREEFAQMIYNAVEKEATIEQLQNYYDVPNTRWSYNAVQLVGNSLKETSDGYVYFYPTQPIQRQEVAKVLSDFFEYEEKDTISLNNTFKDANSIKEEYSSAVANMYESGLMQGVQEDEFAPEKSLTRAQAATMISRIIDKIGKKEVEPKPIENEKDLNLEFLKLENQKKNMIYSPLSIKYALKMLSCGANGKTKSEIDSLVGNIELTKYKNIEKVLSLANSIYIRDSYKEYVKDEFIKKVNDNYDAEIKIDSFANAKNVNDWISEKTFGIIQNMIKDQLVQSEDLKMLLINALAIDMEWSTGFSFEKTYGRDFYLENGSTVEATTMYKETSSDDISYYIDNDVTVLAMDLKQYDDVQLEFDAIMPSKNLSEFAKDITSDEVNGLLSKMKKASSISEELKIRIPKFKFEYDLKLKDDLQALGMKEAFSRYDADFTEMTSNTKGLYVGEALHKANIEFTEKGIKAAAVTVFAMFEKSSIPMPKQTIDINIDHPFLFLIRDKATGEVWFVGTVYEPNLWKNDASEYASKPFDF